MAIPLLVAGGIAAAGAIAKGASAAAGAGKNRRSANFFYDPTGQRGTGHNANAANWGGDPNGAAGDAARLRWGADHAQTRQAEQVNYGQANDMRNMGLQARGQQQQVAGLMMGRATGAVPSIAGQQAAVDMNRAAAAQASQAASARGAAGLALAGQTAANNTANVQSQISNNAQINAANERLQAENAAMGAYSNIRGGDVAGQAQDAQQAQTQAQINAQQRAANDAFSSQFTAQEMGVKQAQLNAKMQEQNILANSYNQSEALNQGAAQANANREGQQVDNIINGITDMGKTAGTAGMGSDTRMKQSLLLEKGRAEGARMAAQGVDPADVAAIRYGSWSQNASPAALDDRYRQNEVGPETVGRAGLNSAIEAQIAKDARANPQKRQDELTLARGGRAPAAPERTPDQVIQDDGARAQWERSFGSAEGAENDARTADNLKEAQKIRESFGQDASGREKSMPWYMMPAPPGLFDSDERVKEKAFEAGAQAALDAAHRDAFAGLPLYDDAPEREPREAVTRGASTLETKGPKYAYAKAERAPEPPPEPYKELPPPFSTPKKGYTVELPPEHEKPYSRGPSLREQISYDNLTSGAFDDSQAAAYAQRFAPSEPLSLVPGRKTSGATHATPARKRSMDSDERAKVKGVDRGDVADANRAMRGEPYTYKAEHTPPNERPGQPHFGFMAQNLERSPVSRVAVEEGPDGMKRVDRDRMLQVVAAGVADLQRQQDETRLALRKGGRR